MFLEQVFRPCRSGVSPVQRTSDAPLVVLDLCAAPGGKSTHLLSLLPSDSLLVSNEVVRNRTQVLAENLTKWGAPNSVVTQNDPADFARLSGRFDVMLTDVPCSGEGMFRKDSVAIDEWSPENVGLCYQRQRRILNDAWPCLKPGGLLVYSTCTYNVHEDEENVAWICEELGAEPITLDVPAGWQVTGSLDAAHALPVYRFLPHKTCGEGFFLAVLRKRDDDTAVAEVPSVTMPRKVSKAKRPATLPAPLLQTARTWLEAPDAYDWTLTGQTLSAIPMRHKPLIDQFRTTLRVVQAGIDVAEVKGRDLLPLQALAMSQDLRCDAFPRVELDYPQAIAYLRKEAVVLPSDATRGVVLLTYRHVPLGFAKNIGNRANNLYPQAWRIRSGYVPESVVQVLSFN